MKELIICALVLVIVTSFLAIGFIMGERDELKKQICDCRSNVRFRTVQLEKCLEIAVYDELYEMPQMSSDEYMDFYNSVKETLLEKN